MNLRKLFVFCGLFLFFIFCPFILLAQASNIVSIEKKGGADIAIGQGRYVDAEKICRDELRSNIKNQDAWIYLCLSIFLQGRYSECRKECHNALQYFYLGFFSDLSSQTWYNVRNYDKALSSFAASVKRQPRYSGYRRQVGWFHAGKMYEERKQYHNAYAAYKEAIRLDNKNFSYFEGAGDVCVKIGLKEKALSYYEKSLSFVGKSSKSYKRLKEKLNALKPLSNKKIEAESTPSNGASIEGNET